MGIVKSDDCGYMAEGRNEESCPKCGSDNLFYEVRLVDRVTISENLKGKSNKRTNKKKPLSEFQSGKAFSNRKGAFVEKIRKIDRENNLYYEYVVDSDTGEIIHKCCEPLSEHQGHGSAKFKIK